MDGVIITYDTTRAMGIVRADGGKLFAFEKADWRGSLPPRRKDRVEFAVEGGAAKEIHFPQGREPGGLRRAAAAFDLGLISGVYAAVYLTAAIVALTLSALMSTADIGESELIIMFVAFVLLDFVTAAAWIWGSNYKRMRGFASVTAIVGTAMAAAFVIKNALQGGA